MKTWVFHNSQEINEGIHFEKKTINSITTLRFNPGGCVAQYSMAKQGISILTCCTRSAEEIEILRKQEHAAKQTTATRRYKELLELAKMPIQPPVWMYSDMKLNIALFCSLLWALFGDECNYYMEIMKVLQVLDSWGAYATRSAYTPEIYWGILWAVLHEGRQFFDKKLLTTAFMHGKTVFYPMCLLNILDKVLNTEPIARPTYPSAWFIEAERSRQILPKEPQSIPPPASWPAQPSASGGLPAPAGGQMSRQQQQQSVDKHHPQIKSLMDPYLVVHNNRVNINKILAAANKH